MTHRDPRGEPVWREKLRFATTAGRILASPFQRPGRTHRACRRTPEGVCQASCCPINALGFVAPCHPLSLATWRRRLEAQLRAFLASVAKPIRVELPAHRQDPGVATSTRASRSGWQKCRFHTRLPVFAYCQTSPISRILGPLSRWLTPVAKRIAAVFRGVSCPTTFAEAGSQLHRVCLTRLHCAFRFSQPPDALLHPQPLQPCFMPVTSVGFCFQRFLLSGSSPASRRKLPLMPFHTVMSASAKTDLHHIRLQGFVHPESPFTVGRRYPVSAGRSSLSLHLFEVFPHTASVSCFHETSSHGLQHGAVFQLRLDAGFRRHARSSESQRTAGWLASFEGCLPP